jgi:hypothetical protein
MLLRRLEEDGEKLGITPKGNGAMEVIFIVCCKRILANCEENNNDEQSVV